MSSTIDSSMLKGDSLAGSFSFLPRECGFKLASLNITSLPKPRENEGTEREAPGPALGICHVYESYF